RAPHLARSTDALGTDLAELRQALGRCSALEIPDGSEANRLSRGAIMMGRRAAVGLGALVCALAASANGRAQDGASQAAAEVACEEGKRLMQSGRYDEACPKFAESNKLDPGVGILFYLADCYEKAGKTASAWGMFRQAIDVAKRAGQADRERIGRER